MLGRQGLSQIKLRTHVGFGRYRPVQPSDHTNHKAYRRESVKYDFMIASDHSCQIGCFVPMPAVTLQDEHVRAANRCMLGDQHQLTASLNNTSLAGVHFAGAPERFVFQSLLSSRGGLAVCISVARPTHAPFLRPQDYLIQFCVRSVRSVAHLTRKASIASCVMSHLPAMPYPVEPHKFSKA